MTQNGTIEERLGRLLDRAELLGRNLHSDGYRHNPIRQSFLKELRGAVDQAAALGAEDLRGAGSGPDEFCWCGDRITWHEGEWLHIINPALRGTDHDAEPAGGYYKPGGGDLEEN
jgi:hypothetical protein